LFGEEDPDHEVSPDTEDPEAAGIEMPWCCSNYSPFCCSFCQGMLVKVRLIQKQRKMPLVALSAKVLVHGLRK
jgi:hypothetical protein